MSSEERLDASRIVIILVGRHHPKQQTSKRNMYPLENFNLPLPFPASLTGMVQSYTLLPSHNILIPLAMRSFHWLQRMVTKCVSSWRVAHLYLISYMFPKVKEGFSRIYVKLLKGKCPKVCGGCSVLCQLHDNLSMCRGSFLNLTCCQAQIETTKKYRKTSSSMCNILSSTQNNNKIWLTTHGTNYEIISPTWSNEKSTQNENQVLCITLCQGTKLRSRTASGVISQVPVALASHVSVSPVCGAAPGIHNENTRCHGICYWPYFWKEIDYKSHIIYLIS